jgi:hypothetical protein
LLLHLHLRGSEIKCRHLRHVSELVESLSTGAISGSLEWIKAGTHTSCTASCTWATRWCLFRFQHVEIEHDIEYLILLLDVTDLIRIFLKLNQLVYSLRLFFLPDLNESVNQETLFKGIQSLQFVIWQICGYQFFEVAQEIVIDEGLLHLALEERPNDSREKFGVSLR